MDTSREDTTPDHGELEALHAFALWMHETRAQAVTAVVAALRAAPRGELDDWLAVMCRALPARPRGQGGVAGRLRALDDRLRSERTVPALDHPLVAGDDRRLRVLQREMQRACLVAVVQALRPGWGAVFVMHTVLGLTEPRIAAILGTTADAIVEMRRGAIRKLADYLDARCQHIDPRNMCSCASRVGVALQTRFIDWPDHDAPSERPFDAARRQVAAVYAELPAVRLSSAAAGELVAAARRG